MYRSLQEAVRDAEARGTTLAAVALAGLACELTYHLVTYERQPDLGPSLALLALSPVLLLIAILIRLDSPGPSLFRQKRYGFNQEAFWVFKFRSMRQEADAAFRQATRDDDRITRIGRFLRRTNLDELPQLLNVIRGDMSLVGPRAHVLGMHAAGVRYEDLVPEYFARHSVRPGITGLAQVRGLRGEVTDATHARARVASDLEYIRSFSIWADIRILLQTIPAVLMGRAAY